MADSVSQKIRNIVNKVDPNTPVEDVVDYFWTRVQGKGEGLSEDVREKWEREVRKCHQENVKAAGRAERELLEA